jgi:endothelin-converting enzyme/putative endopeptidase
MRPSFALLFLSLTASCVAESEAKKPPAPSKPMETGIDPSALDKTINPCDDFYHYACGNWLKRTPIPEDRPAWLRSFSEIDERNQNTLKKILDDLAAGRGDKSDPYSDKVGAYYGACMDEVKVEATADKELADALKRIDAVTSLDALAREVARQHLGIGAPLFRFRSQQDYKDASLVVGDADQGGLGLPDRDYYLKDDGKFKEIRGKYEEHVKTMLGFAGVPAAEAAKQAQTIVRIEKMLAEASLSRTERRDPKKLANRLELKGLEQAAPRFPWKLYLGEIGEPSVTQINVSVPKFFTALNATLDKVPLADWRVYLKWHFLHGANQALSKKFVDEGFNFYYKTLQGVDKILPRWKRCAAATDKALGEALARPFVRLSFGPEGKDATQAMVKAIEAAMEKNLGQLAWMDEPTRKAAFAKLHDINNKIGYPDKWRSYDALTVTRDSFLSNLERASVFESKRVLDKIGKPVDRNEWFMTPPTVNAYYEPSLNEMVFPAGILQPPFYNRAAPMAVNFGAAGMVMGHELTHGFDDEGRKYDAKGNLTDWWTPAVNQEFEKRAACVAEQYDGYTVLGDLHLNGKLTLGENIADLGGIKLAHSAYLAARKGPSKLGEFTDEQLFFLGTAQAWCGNRRDAFARMRVTTDPHSPPEYRVNGPLSNLKEFADAFQCKPDAKMVRQSQCVVW